MGYTVHHAVVVTTFRPEGVTKVKDEGGDTWELFEGGWVLTADHTGWKRGQDDAYFNPRPFEWVVQNYGPVRPIIETYGDEISA